MDSLFLSDHPVNQYFPADFVQRLHQIVPAEFLPQVYQRYQTNPRTAFRVNPLIRSPEHILADLHLEGIEAYPLSWCSNAYLLADENQRTALVNSEAVRFGQAYIQNPSSMIPSLLLNPQEGEEILDLAAAPGGKTLHLASLMNQSGRLAAVEAVRKRFFKLKANVERSGATNIDLYLKDGRAVGKVCPERFDAVLLDAPCSSEARFTLNDPESWSYWSLKKVREVSQKQKGLLRSAWKSLKPGGRLVYCTCSLAPEENEGVIHKALQMWGDEVEVLSVQEALQNLGFMDLSLPSSEQGKNSDLSLQNGLTKWGKKTFDSRLSLSARVLASSLFNGFYLCLLSKKERPS